jgi:hypothetical protein
MDEKIRLSNLDMIIASLTHGFIDEYGKFDEL